MLVWSGKGLISLLRWSSRLSRDDQNWRYDAVISGAKSDLHMADSPVSDLDLQIAVLHMQLQLRRQLLPSSMRAVGKKRQYGKQGGSQLDREYDDLPPAEGEKREHHTYTHVVFGFRGFRCLQEYSCEVLMSLLGCDGWRVRRGNEAIFVELVGLVLAAVHVQPKTSFQPYHPGSTERGSALSVQFRGCCPHATFDSEKHGRTSFNRLLVQIQCICLHRSAL